jgi:hypothetical protein
MVGKVRLDTYQALSLLLTVVESVVDSTIELACPTPRPFTLSSVYITSLGPLWFTVNISGAFTPWGGWTSLTCGRPDVFTRTVLVIDAAASLKRLPAQVYHTSSSSYGGSLWDPTVVYFSRHQGDRLKNMTADKIRTYCVRYIEVRNT